MKIQTKILWSLLGMSLLIALIGAFAVNRQHVAALKSATQEAENIAHLLGLALISDSDQLDASAQEIVGRLHEKEGRDVVLVDTHKRVLADAVPASIGEIFADDQGDAVAATIRDGRVRIFVELSKDQGTALKQVVAPIHSKSGQTLGAVILEYGQRYDELMQTTKTLVRELILSVFVGVTIALFIAFYLGRLIGKPLEQLTNAATGFASGRTDLSMPAPRKDEIGNLATAFSNMMQKRQQAEEELQRMRDELEVRVAKRTAELATVNESLLVENAERKRAEAVSFRLAAIVESSDEGIIGIDLNGIITSWNKGAEKTFGYAASEMVGASTILLLPADRRDEVDRTLKKIRRGQCVEHFETLRQTKDGRLIDVSVTESPIKDATGKVIGMSKVARDITERKLSEAMIEKAHQELVKVSRQAGMSEVATSVLHNVGNVLNSVNVASACVADTIRKSQSANLSKVVMMLHEHETDLGDFLTSDPKGKQIPNYLAKLAERLVGDQAAALKELAGLQKNIGHIKDVVAMQQSYGKVSGVTETLQVNALIEDALRMNLSSLMRHDVRVIKEFESVPAITVEKHKVLQILVNLVRNAKQACDESNPPEKRLTLRVTDGKDQVRIAVTDNGNGIPTENLTRIFAHGFTTKKDGHGFGLHSAVLAAKEMGGALTVQSEGTGKGATFTLTLPMQPPKETHDHSSSPEESPCARN